VSRRSRRPPLRAEMYAVITGPFGSAPVGFVDKQRRRELITKGIVRVGGNGHVLQILPDVRIPREKLSSEAARVVEIAQFQQKSCQGGLINPR
jgi:hypothetical protein